MRLSGREESRVLLVEKYCKEQGLFRTDSTPDPVFTDSLELDLSTVVPSLAGPKRPQDRVPLSQSKEMFRSALTAEKQKLFVPAPVVPAPIGSSTETAVDKGRIDSEGVAQVQEEHSVAL